MHADNLTGIHELGDLGLAPVLCLTAEQHGIVLVSAESLDEVAREMAAICSENLGLSTVVLECSQGTHLDHFRESILVETIFDEDEDLNRQHQHPLEHHHFTSHDIALDQRRVADVVIAKNLNQADYHVQIQVLELIQKKRIYTRAAMHSTSRNFVLIALNEAASDVHMNPHLNDAFAISHLHTSSSDAASLRSQSSASATSLYSVLRTKGRSTRPQAAYDEQLGPEVLSDLRKALSHITMTAEVSAYLQNVVVAMRLHRFVAGGVSALATRHLRMVAKAMAVLHGLDFVTPAIAALAVRKVYYHRLTLADENTERSLRWGGDPLAVQRDMQQVTVELAIDAIISSVQSPL